MTAPTDLSKGGETASRRQHVRARRSFVAVLFSLMGFLALQLGLSVAVEMRLPELRDLIYIRRLHCIQQSVRAEPSKPYNDENDFLGSHHLLKSGRDKFKERLGRETIVPLLRRHYDEEKAAGEVAARSSQS